jgi:hypothetical protein
MSLNSTVSKDTETKHVDPQITTPRLPGIMEKKIQLGSKMPRCHPRQAMSTLVLASSDFPMHAATSWLVFN